MTEQVVLTTDPLPYRLTLDDFFRLDAAGAFTSYGKTELIRGEILYVNSQHRPHARAKGLLHIELAKALERLELGLDVLIEATVAMSAHNAPEPDLVITSEAEGDGPVPVSSVRLLVEIADTTQANDLRTKAVLYAEHEVPEYWVLDLKAKQLHRMWAPLDGRFTQADRTTFGQPVASATIVGLSLDTTALH